MLKITYAELSQAADIADFQCKMALETEHLKLDKQIVNQATAYLIKHPEHGQYFVPIYDNQPQKACGSLAITYENQKSWWIQSVFVREEHRKKGLFTSLFKAVVEEGKIKGAKSISLYVQKENIRAKKIYQKLGMYCNGNQFYGLDLVYGNEEARKHLESDLMEGVKVIEQQTKQNVNQAGFETISGKFSQHNKTLKITEGDSVIGVCQYFTQFSDWRFGIMPYVSYFIAKPQKQRTVLESSLQYLYRNFTLKIGAIRIICKQDEVKWLSQIMPDMHRDVYDVMQIDL